MNQASNSTSHIAGSLEALEQCRKLLEQVGITEDSALAAELIQAVLRLAADRPGRAEMKLILRAIKEIRYGFKMFKPYRQSRKISIFGSARTARSAPDYAAARQFGQLISAAGFMVITGAGGGIMQAGHEGAGLNQSFGVAIKLPFEQKVNAVISGDPKLAYFRYFFSRKLMFIKESNAVALFPGGFGTHDEAFEALTLVQTGRADPMPIVMIDHPGGTYWRRWEAFVHEALLAEAMISPDDTSLYLITDDVNAAVSHITTFYRNYVSMRFVDRQLVLRIRQAPAADELDRLNADFHDILAADTIRIGSAAESEPPDAPMPDLPRLVLHFNRNSAARLRQLINRLNVLDSLPQPSTLPVSIAPVLPHCAPTS